MTQAPVDMAPKDLPICIAKDLSGQVLGRMRWFLAEPLPYLPLGWLEKGAHWRKYRPSD